MKTGRNDPCPCGSGKKYKRCCLNKQASTTSAADLTWRRIRDELGDQPARTMRFVDQAYGPVAILEAWEEFTLWDDGEGDFDPETPHLSVFMPWFLHCWSPNPDETEVVDTELHEVVPTQAWLQRKGHRLAPISRTYMESCMARPFSFYEVEQVEPGRSVTLCDLLTSERHQAFDHSASCDLQPHSLVYAQLASAGGITLVEGLCQRVFPPSDKVRIIELRKSMRHNASRDVSGVTQIDPDEWDFELRELYLSMMDEVLYPTLPQLVTSDGEALEFHELVYDTDSAQSAFDALKHLDAISDDPEASADIQRDEAGSVQRAHIDWGELDQGEDAESGTLLGSIDIVGTQLTAETRSRERAERLKGIIQAKLGSRACLRHDHSQSVDDMRANAPPQSSGPAVPQDDPETLAVLTQYLRKHYTEWLDTPIPMLGNQTPRHVAQTADGREQVEAMLRDAQNQEIGLPVTARQAIFYDIRQQLGLPT